MSNSNPRIIIDANYIFGMPNDGAPFRTLCEQGARIVLIDTLVFELCTTDDPNQWPASINKLKAGVNAIEVWQHVPPMFLFELEQNRPYGDPLDKERTERLRDMIANNPQYQPSDMRTLIEDAKKEREGYGIVELFQNFANWEPPADEIKNKAGDDDKVIDLCYDVVNNPDFIRSLAIGNLRQRSMKTYGLDVSLNLDDVDDSWVIWHEGKSHLVLFCESQRRGADTRKNVSKKLEKRLINAKHDLDYLISLAFADGIASFETKEMYYFWKWMYGDTKPRLDSFDPAKIARFVNDLKRSST